LNRALKAYPRHGDRLWPALARHIARRSTVEDRGSLEDLVQDPKKREPPLRWGLQYMVRGDVWLNDGTVLTLDQLADEAGVARLPFLEDMPEHIDLDLDSDEE